MRRILFADDIRRLQRDALRNPCRTVRDQGRMMHGGWDVDDAACTAVTYELTVDVENSEGDIFMPAWDGPRIAWHASIVMYHVQGSWLNLGVVLQAGALVLPTSSFNPEQKLRVQGMLEHLLLGVGDEPMIVLCKEEASHAWKPLTALERRIALGPTD